MSLTQEPVHIVGGGLAGSECAFQLASRGVPVVLHEMRPVRPTPAHEDLVVFYVADPAEWQSACARMRQAGFAVVPSFNPYWDVRGVTFEDPDGYRVVLQNADWVSRETTA